MNALPASFVHRGVATRLVMREGAIDGLRAELDALGIARPLVLGGASSVRCWCCCSPCWASAAGPSEEGGPIG